MPPGAATVYVTVLPDTEKPVTAADVEPLVTVILPVPKLLEFRLTFVAVSP
jgi:hypothetical protein